MSVSIYFPALASNKYVEGPDGYYTYPAAPENPEGSGLLDIPDYLDTTDDMLYSIPPFMLSQGTQANGNLTQFSVQEDATPIEPGSTFGGVGQIIVGLDDFPDSTRLIGEVVLTDGSRGKTSGMVKSISATDGNLTLTADSALGLFNTERTAQPFTGTLRAAVQYYCDLVGITNDVIVDAAVANRTVVYPGWVGNVWVHIKQMLSTEQVEIALVFNRIYVRPLRQIIANQDKMSSSGKSLDNSNSAKKIEIYYYNHVYGSNIEVYPLTTEEPNTYVVGAGETVVFTQKLNATLSFVNQPTVVNFVNDESYAGTDGVYSVTGSDDKPVTAEQWLAQGGSLSVRITDDPSVIEVTITGASMTDYAPYRISMSAGGGSDYNSLHITGTGVVWDKRLVTLRTGATNTTTSTEVGVTVDNIYVSSLAQAYSLGTKTAQAYAGVNYTRTGTAYDLNRRGEGRDLIQATVEDFNLAYEAGMTVAEFNVEWAGQTVADFNEYWQTQVDLLWENQLFGNAPGARLLTSDANFRIVSATTTESSVQYSAVLDTMVTDFNTAWTGETVSDFNAQWAGLTAKDFSVSPLRRA
jgi:hypothetical protein